MDFISVYQKWFGKKITVRHLFDRLASFITANTIVIADVGDCLFGALELVIPRDTEFLAPALPYSQQPEDIELCAWRMEDEYDRLENTRSFT